MGNACKLSGTHLLKPHWHVIPPSREGRSRGGEVHVSRAKATRRQKYSPVSLKFNRPDIKTFIWTIVEKENDSKAAAEKKAKPFTLPREQESENAVGGLL